MDKTVKPMNIFISYGKEIRVHDESGNPQYPEPNNESVVRKVKTYLENQGHHVWIDKEIFRPGDDWRRTIYEAIEYADVVLFFLSDNAMNPFDIFMEEISIALRIRRGNMFFINLDASVDSNRMLHLLNNNLFTEFQNWLLHWTEEGIDDAWFDQTIHSLDRSLQKVMLYSGEMRELKKLLRPWNNNYRLRKLDIGTQILLNEKTYEYEKKIVHRFCGRESLFKMFEERIMNDCKADRLPSDRVLWLKKGPGFGKSRFASELYYRFTLPISAVYFIEYKQEETRKPHTFIRSVAYQLAQVNDAYRIKLLSYLKENQEKINFQTDDPNTLLKKLIVDLLSDDAEGKKATQWILVDAMDEAMDDNQYEIAMLISQNLDKFPPWLCFFITSREIDVDVNRYFDRFKTVEFSDEENDKDLREYIHSEIEGMGLSVSDELVNILLENANGSFLYPEMVFRDLKKNSMTLADIQKLPTGVIRYIYSQFERFFSKDLELYDKEVRPALGYILTSCEPLPRAVLKHCLGISRDSELDNRLRLLGTFYVQSGDTDEDSIAPFNKSVIDFCFDRNISMDYYVNPDQANENFAKKGLELYKSGALQWTTRSDEEPNTVQRYFLNWLPSHLMNANMTKEAADVLSDFAFLMKRLRFVSVERVLLDYLSFRDKLSGISSDCDAYFDVICSNAHFLRRDSINNRAYKIMLQIAADIADACPVTQAAQRWLNPKDSVSPCDWFWFNKGSRSKEYSLNPCKLVIENSGNHELILSNSEELSKETGTSNDLDGNTDTAAGSLVLCSGDILTWGIDNILRIWSPDGWCKAILEGHTDRILGALELRSGDILSWSKDNDLRLWTPDGTCKAILDGFTDRIQGVIELRSGSILSWGESENDLRLWSHNGTCKAVLEGHTDRINGVKELNSGDILSWSKDNTMRYWSPNATGISIRDGHTQNVEDVIEISTGEILSRDIGRTIRIWSQDGICKEVIQTDNPQYSTFESHFSNQATNRSHNPLSVKLSNWGIELQYDSQPVARWNCPSCHYRFIGDGRICVWYGSYIEFLQLNYGNCMGITFEEAQQRLLTDNRNN